MHGAGLSHVMFLPRQVTKVALVEVYNTMDDHCFKDLARLSDAEYFTWDPKQVDLLHPEQPVTVHTAKHVNYRPDPVKFVDLVTQAIKHVRGTPPDHTEL
jgi:protein O-GlcNAc transferase